MTEDEPESSGRRTTGGTGHEALGRALRPYQADAVPAITGGLQAGSRGQVIMACGTGKTRVAAEAAADLVACGVIVVLVPSIALAAQTLSAWPADCPVDAAFAACSDPTVGDGARTSDLAVPVSTDPEVLAGWLAAAEGRVLVVATYDSAHRLDEALRRAGRGAGVVVCDEAHRTAGRVDKMTAAVLREDFLPGRRLYLTATPRVSIGVRAGGELTVASMDDPQVYGPVLYRYPFGTAISEGWLKDYRLLVAALADAHVRDLLGSDPDLAEDGVPVRMAAAQAALAMAAAGYGLRRCVAFLPRVADARLFAWTLPRILDMLPPERRPAGPVSAGFVHGGMTSAQRDLALDRLRNPPAGGWAVVANARCLGEGVDIPAIDSVLFAAPKTSVIDIAQAAGRALRPHRDADTATIIVPALLPPDGDGSSEPGDGGQWEPVLNVVRALAAHDEALTAQLGRTRASRAAADERSATQNLPARIIVQAPPGTVSRTVESLCLRIVDGTASSWWDGYGKARAYHAAHGDLNVPNRYLAPDGFSLGAWLSRQRISRGAGRLAADQVAALDELGMTWDVMEAAWMRAYEDARAFRDEHGHLEVPPERQTADGTSLAGWLRFQRAQLRAGRMPPHRRSLLEQIGLSADPDRERWLRRYHDLTSALTHYDGRLPKKSDAASWLTTQRALFRAGSLDQDKITLLEQAGVRLKPPAETWPSRYQALLAYKAEYGHTRVPPGYRTADRIPLGNCVAAQRVAHANAALSAERERLLDDAGFCWNAREETWQARYQEARTHLREHGHLRPPRGTALRSWLYDQRRQYREGGLTEEHARLLAALGVLSQAQPTDQPGDGGTR